MQHLERGFKRDDLYYNSKSSRASLGSAPTVHEVDFIRNKVGELLEDDDSEAAWNSYLHGPLSMAAERCSIHSNTVCFKNM